MSDRPLGYGFLLTHDFSLVAFSSAVETLRMANRTSGRDLYRWSLLSLDDQLVRSSAGLTVKPDGRLAEAAQLDGVFVCSGVHAEQQWSPELGEFLKHLADCGLLLGGLCTGSWQLAKAGVLDGYRCTVHWELLDLMREFFPRVQVRDEVFEIDRDRYTCAGGTAPLDMMLYLVARQMGRPVALAISEQFIVDRIRDLGESQDVTVRNRSPGAPRYLEDAVALMKSNLPERLFVGEIAAYLNLSRRQLERAFKRYFNVSPSQYYLNLRLARARKLLRAPGMTVQGVARVAGFRSPQHFSKCYHDHFKVRPIDERIRGGEPPLAGSQ